MDLKIQKARLPGYLKKFKCIGPPCEDNCCIGWDVDIDKKTFFAYQKVEDEELQKLFKKCLHRNTESFSVAVDYAKVRLQKGKRCPFLNDEKLCRIQAKLSEASLSNVCATYPRFTNLVNDVYEYSATVSCPEAARLILLNKNGLKITEVNDNTESRRILMYRVDTKKPGQNMMAAYLLELREFSISILKDRSYKLDERLLILGYFYTGLQKLADVNKHKDVLLLIREFEEKIRLKNLNQELGALPASLERQMSMLSGLADQLHVEDEIDSKSYIVFTKEVLSGLSGTKAKNPAKTYGDSYRLYYQSFMSDHDYILENYLVNYVYSNLFPAGESERPFEAYCLLAVRYALIKYHLIGIAASRKGLTEKLVVDFIQSFSKAVEHHKTFIDSLPGYLRKKNFLSISQIAFMLKQ